LEIAETDKDSVRKMVDQLKQKIDKGIIFLATIKEDKVHLIVGVTENLKDTYKANTVAKWIWVKFGDGKAWGRDTLAEGIAGPSAKLTDIIAAFRKFEFKEDAKEKSKPSQT
jgi:alanyl-tRNA synthetase